MNDLISRVRQYRYNYYSRQQLKVLDAAALKDIGVSRAEALKEAQRPFWDSKCCEEIPYSKSRGIFPYNVISLVLVLGLGLTVCFNIK